METLHDLGQELEPPVHILLSLESGGKPALHDDLRSDGAFRLQQDGVHMDARRGTRRHRLKSLGAADFTAVDRNSGIVRHVLRLEGPNLQSAIGEGARQAGSDERFADIGAGALKHDGTGQSELSSRSITWA